GWVAPEAPPAKLISTSVRPEIDTAWTSARALGVSPRPAVVARKSRRGVASGPLAQPPARVTTVNRSIARISHLRIQDRRNSLGRRLPLHMGCRNAGRGPLGRPGT